jgi:serine/threonine protein kinase/formylglycine-generating enzyme required for sulfatase activity/tetratricopeptide (TPR) repeat protein
VNNELPSDILDVIDALCDEFEDSWKHGSPKIEAFLPRIAPTYRDQLLEHLIRLEADLRFREHDAPALDEYLQRFPDHPKIVQAGFDQFERRRVSGDAAPASTQTPPSSEDEPLLTNIGNYRVLELVGRGNFGVVYKVRDPANGKVLAAKLLRSKWATIPEYRQLFLKEARHTLDFKHPGIVAVLAVEDHDGRPYLIQEYIAGGSLCPQTVRAERSHGQIADLMVYVADAVAYIHRQGLYHRDLKPDNILIDASGRPRVADFGLAMHVREGWKQRGHRAGTPLYMSPEQLRCEWHLVNASTDIWSLGVIFYELLTGERPFSGSSSDMLREEIERRQPRGLREIDETIPAELQRICLKCLDKSANQRYPSAADLRDDLQSWREAPLSRMGAVAAATAGVVGIRPPGGLRPFTKEHADFFLELLPGLRDRNGLPNSISYWKSRIEQLDTEETFCVGVLYGVSGCGKSSLLQAGLLPNLAEHVTSIYLKASADDTETRLLRQLRKHFPGLADARKAEMTLPEAIGLLRESNLLATGHKLLIVIDQVEQWLQSRQGEPAGQLIDALRQCDGCHVQALVCVRDGFRVSIDRLLQAVGSKLDSEENYQVVDLFDKRHSRKVLTLLGRAYGRLDHSPTPEQEEFLERAVGELAEADGRIVCVRLIVFAEIMKTRDWTLAELEQLGGLQGVGVRFMRDSFEGRSAPESHRSHQPAAMKVLSSLVPGMGVQIKGGQRTLEQLQVASGYVRRPNEFAQLIRILEYDLKLITPVDPQQAEGSLEEASAGTSPDSVDVATNAPQQSYTLTHDFLVPVVREWVELTEGETARGRARLRLRRRANAWEAEQKDRQLPSLSEYVNVRALTTSREWTSSQRKMMKRARHVHLARTLVTVAILAALGLSAILIRQNVVKQQDVTWAQGLVESLVRADTQQVPEIVRQLGEYAQLADPELRQKFGQAEEGCVEKLHLALALVDHDDRQVEYLYNQLLRADAARFPVIRDALRSYQDRLKDRLWSVLTSQGNDPEQERLRAAGALASYDPQSPKWNEVAVEVTNQLMEVNPVFLGQWQETLRPMAKRLIPPLIKIHTDPKRGELPRSLATSLLADYAKDDVETLTLLVIDADTRAFTTLFPALQRHGHVAVEKLQAVIDQKLEPTWNDPPVDSVHTEVALEMRATIEAAHGIVAERFAFCQDLPWDKFSSAQEALGTDGYRLVRIRPWLSDNQRWVAAIWTRDGQRWELQTDLTKMQLPTSDALAEKDGLLPADIAILPSAIPAAEPHFVLLWGPATTAVERRRMIVDASEKELMVARNALAKAGFGAQTTICVWTDAAGQRHYAGIWSNQVGTSELLPAYAGFELLLEPQWDVAVAPAGKLTDPRDAYREQLAQIAALPADQLDQPQTRLLRAQVQYHLGELESALADLDFLVERNAISASVLQYRVWTLARLRKADEARAELVKYLERDEDPSTQAYVQIVLAAWLGNFDEAARQLDAIVTASPQNADTLLNAARAAALASQACADSDASRSMSLLDRAFAVLDTAVTQGYKIAQQLRTDIDLAQLHADPRFLALLGKLDAPWRFAAVWRDDIQFESKLIGPTSPESLLEQARELAAQGFRPVAIALSELLKTPTAGTAPLASVPLRESAVVWHRLLVPDINKEQLAVRQANAAVALLRMGIADQVWPLLKHRPDPRLRSYLLDHLASCGADPVAIWQQLSAQKDESIRRALILALGDYAAADLIGKALSSTISSELLRLYREDADPGIHGAAEWTLKQLGHQVELSRARSELATGEIVGQRRWYVTKQSQHTMVILTSKEPFLMGSPVTELERPGFNELRHVRKIDRTFAIGSQEVTISEIEACPAFQAKDSERSRILSRDDNAPATRIQWYIAAQYCNWLSEQEGISRDQWCYDQPFPGDMRLGPDYLHRTGYRLPTEAEWEYACRAEATTARPYGETGTLLGRYAWYWANSAKEWANPVACLRPNDFGLFDMLGNVSEWCNDAFEITYPVSTPVVWDLERPEMIRDTKERVLRGGSFLNGVPFARSAARYEFLPSVVNANCGFRLARTVP